MEDMWVNGIKLVNFVDFGEVEDENIKIDGFCIRIIEIVFCILYLLIGIMIFIGNSFICVVFLILKCFWKSFMNVFFVSFVFWDVFMVILVVLFYVVFCSWGCDYFFI